MKKNQIKTTYKLLISDKPLYWLAIAMVVAGIFYVILVGLNVKGSDVTVYSRYSAFGSTHFYKAYWHYTMLFVIFGVLVVVSHLAMLLKLQKLEKRNSAIFIGWLAIMILVVASFYAISVLHLGRSA